MEFTLVQILWEELRMEVTNIMGAVEDRSHFKASNSVLSTGLSMEATSRELNFPS